MQVKVVGASVVFVGLVLAGSAHAQLLGPTPYLSAADSPFAGLTYDYYHIEDFEDDRFTPGLTALNGVVTGPGPFADSVDGDDGAIDGSGTAGRSYFSSSATSVFEFRFDIDTLFVLPSHVGVVWTDVGNVLNGNTGFGEVIFEAFDRDGVSLGASTPVLLGDGVATGGTSEDRFFGMIHPGGISRITISMANSVDWEVDHVQYLLVPAPGAAGVLGASALACVRRRRR